MAGPRPRRLNTALKAAFMAVWLAGGALPAAAQEAGTRVSYLTDGKAQFTVTAPDRWVVATGADRPLPEGEEGPPAPRVLSLHPEEDFSLWIGLMTTPGPASLEEAEAYVQDMGPNLLSEGTVTRETDGQFGSVPARFYRGSGARDGAPVEFAVAIAGLPSGRMAIGVFLGEHGAREIYADEIETIIRSFTPAEETP